MTTSTAPIPEGAYLKTDGGLSIQYHEAGAASRSFPSLAADPRERL